jgi:hypothetical protein
MMNVFTYWEGSCPFINRYCIDRIRDIFSDRHVHLTPESIYDYVNENEVPNHIKKTSHVGLRADFLRALLLKDHGGWWFDCDIWLFRDPSELETDKSLIWKENKDDSRGIQSICCAVMFTPKHREKWILEVLARLSSLNINEDISKTENWVVGQFTYTDVALMFREDVEIGECNIFHPIHPEEKWFTYWNGSFQRPDVNYGIQLCSSIFREKINDKHGWCDKILRLENAEQLHEQFPKSILSQYR